MNRIQKLMVGAVCLLGTLMAVHGQADAGTFTMKQCSGANLIDFQAIYSRTNGDARFVETNGCSPASSGKIGVYQDRSGVKLAYGDGGQFVWSAPSKIDVIGTRFSARLKDANAVEGQLFGFRNGIVTDLDGGVTHDGSQRVSVWADPAEPQSAVAARATCAQIAGCANAPTSVKGFMEVYDVEFTVRDVAPPTIAASGELWDWAGDAQYHRGSGSIQLDAADQGAGVAATWIEVNGLRVEPAAYPCVGDQGSYATRFTPCPAAQTSTKPLDTTVAPFQDGANQIRFCARDYASSEAGANRTCTGSRTLLVDNRPSNPPDALRSDRGTEWQAENGFNLRWEIPKGQASPIIGAMYHLIDLESGKTVNTQYFEGIARQSAGPVVVPEAGAYRALIYLVDSAANLGYPAETILRFDDRPPGNVSPEAPDGWVSADELPLVQTVEQAEAGGPSGVTGYALAVSPDGAVSPCAEICLAPEITFSGGVEARTGEVGGLSEGEHWVSAVAVSGAHRSSLEAGSTKVQVDRTPPEASISGVPNEWVNHAVTLTAQAEDRLSGMSALAGDDGTPKTVIDAGSYAPHAVPGSVATFTVATEGVNRVRYWAEDLAGNANDGRSGPDGDTHPSPGQTVVRIDMTPPEARFEQGRDPADPELVTVLADDADSGVASAEIGIRPAGSTGKFETLPTAGDGRRFEARVPSDELARGAYELNAMVRDRAGNEAVGTENTDRETMILNLPLKHPTELTAALSGRVASRSKYGERKTVDGRLTSDGAPLPNQKIEVFETFVAGARQNLRTSEVTTDGDGRYRFQLPAGPSRAVEVAYGGDRVRSRSRSRRLELGVKGKVTLRIRPRKVWNGGLVRMKGRAGMSGALPPARGKLVAIQYLDPTRRKWRPVEVLRTNRRGRFRYSYRFRTIASAQRIVFRAIALSEAGWPYLPSTSGRGSVIVYPKDRSGR